MKNKVRLIYIAPYLFFLGAGFALGVYMLPDLNAENSALMQEIRAAQAQAKYTARFSRDQPGSSARYWAEGDVYISEHDIAFIGKIAPGPDYKLYLTRQQAYDQTGFLKMKSEAVLVGAVDHAGNFIQALPNHINPDDYAAVQIWCERFSAFIASARYQ